MLYLLFFAMLIAFVGALIALPALMAPLVPWWGVVLIVVGELVVLRYTFFRILGFIFGVFVWAGLRVGVRGMRGARVDVHSIRVVPPPGPEEVVRRESGSVDHAEGESEPDAPGTRYVRVDCTVSPSPKVQASNWPVKHYDAGSFKLSSQGFAWPSFPPKDDETRTGEVVAAALLDGEAATPIASDKQLLGSQRLRLTFKCPETLKGPAKLKFVILPLATLDVP
jgi:hypothetical protein